MSYKLNDIANSVSPGDLSATSSVKLQDLPNKSQLYTSDGLGNLVLPATISKTLTFYPCDVFLGISNIANWSVNSLSGDLTQLTSSNTLNDVAIKLPIENYIGATVASVKITYMLAGTTRVPPTPMSFRYYYNDMGSNSQIGIGSVVNFNYTSYLTVISQTFAAGFVAQQDRKHFATIVSEPAAAGVGNKILKVEVNLTGLTKIFNNK